MSNTENFVYETIDQESAGESASTRRKFVGGAAATLGSMGLLGLTGSSSAVAAMSKNDPQTILNVAATAEVLATIVNTVGGERVALGSVEKANIDAAAYEELIHYKVLRSVGGRPATKKIWVPDAVFASSDRAPEHAGDRRSDLHQRVPDRRHRVRQCRRRCQSPASAPSSWAPRPCTERWRSSRWASSATTARS